MPLTTSDISISLLMDTSVAIEEIQARIHARAFAAVMDPTKGTAVPLRLHPPPASPAEPVQLLDRPPTGEPLSTLQEGRLTGDGLPGVQGSHGSSLNSSPNASALRRTGS